MESFGDLMAMPPMYRDMGSTFLAQQMPIPLCGMPYAGYSYGIPPLKQGLNADKFETIQKQKEKNKAERKKVLGIVGGVVATAIAAVILKKKVPAVGQAFSKAGNWIKNLFNKAHKVTP